MGGGVSDAVLQPAVAVHQRIQGNQAVKKAMKVGWQERWDNGCADGKPRGEASELDGEALVASVCREAGAIGWLAGLEPPHERRTKCWRVLPCSVIMPCRTAPPSTPAVSTLRTDPIRCRSSQSCQHRQTQRSLHGVCEVAGWVQVGAPGSTLRAARPCAGCPCAGCPCVGCP